MPFMTQSHFETLPPWLQGPYKRAVERSEAITNEKFKPFPGERLAQIPQDILQAHHIGKKIGVTEPYFEGARGLLGRSTETFPSQYKNYMNPYQQAVINRIAEEGNRNFNERIMPGLEAKFVRLGQHGSSRHAKLAREAARDVQNEILANQAKALSTGYQQAAQIFNADQTRGLEAANQLSGLGGFRQAAQLADISMLTDQGRYQQQQQQALNDIRYNDWLQEQNYPQEMLNQQMGIMQGIPVQRQSTNMTQTPGVPQMNVLGQIGPLAAQIYGARLAYGKKRGGLVNMPRESALKLMKSGKKRR